MDSSSQCRICLESDDDDEMIKPCNCDGSSKYVHRKCIEKWIPMKTESLPYKRWGEKPMCEICHYEFQFEQIDKEEVTHFHSIIIGELIRRWIWRILVVLFLWWFTFTFLPYDVQNVLTFFFYKVPLQAITLVVTVFVVVIAILSASRSYHHIAPPPPVKVVLDYVHVISPLLLLMGIVVALVMFARFEMLNTYNVIKINNKFTRLLNREQKEDIEKQPLEKKEEEEKEPQCPEEQARSPLVESSP